MTALADAGFLAGGLLAGTLHFSLLRWNAALYARRGSLAGAIALQTLRLAAAAALLAFAALHGAVPLLLAALGVVIARPFVVRRLAGDVP